MAEQKLNHALRDSDPQSNSFGTENDGVNLTVHLKTLINIVRRNYLLIGGVVAGVVVLGVIITMLMMPRYQATAQILIEDRADQIIEGGDLQQPAAAADTDRFLQTRLGIIQSRTLALSVVQAGKLDRDPKFFESLGSVMPTEALPGEKLENIRKVRAIRLLIDALVVTLPRDSRIASIMITSRDPELSARLANSYAERFIDYNLSQKIDSSSYARRFLADQLEETRTKLTQSERDLNQYARAAGLIRMSSESEGGKQDAALSVTISKLMQFNTVAATATAERIAAEDRWHTLSNKPPLSITEVNSNSGVMQMVVAKAKAESELADELTRHLEGYSTVKSKRAEIAELNRRIDAIANSIKRSAQVDYQSALEKEKSLLGQVGSLRSDALQEQDRGVQYSVLKRMADTYRTLYESLLLRYNQLNATAGSANNNIAIVDHAVVSRVPSSPNLLLNILLSIILGLLCAAIGVALKEVLDDAIRSPEDVEKKLGLPLLGLIPFSKGGNIDKELGDRKSSISEAYRSLVTNLRYSTSTGLPRVLIITSARESEGKSTAARALATDIATLGKKVLLVDTDLRRPTLHHFLQDTSNSGLTDILTGQKSFDQVVRVSDESPTLSYVTALPTPPDPALILAGEGMGTFLELARNRYDTIVLDCPPLLGLSDVPLLANYADGVLFIIDASSFHRGAVKSALRRLALINANLLGVVLNRFAPKFGNDDYSYYAENYYSYGSKKD
jgi:succinoglycan biosynthesis transport protein ExoP